MKRRRLLTVLSVIAILLALFDLALWLWPKKEAAPPAVVETADPLIKALSAENQQKFKENIYGSEEKALLADNNFIEANLEQYARYREFPAALRLRLVNDGIVNEQNKDLLLQIVQDPYYIYEKTAAYLSAEKDTVRERVEYVNAGRDKEAYVDVKEADLSKGILVNINKYYQFPEGYSPDDLVQIDAKYGLQSYLRREAYAAYEEMDAAATADGMRLLIVSAYRSYDKQVSLYNSYVANDGVEAADTYSARPGHSDHQTGLVVDVLSPTTDFSDFYQSPEAKWLAENAHKYGFIMRYPEGKDDVTGYEYEAWHFRYIGRETAAKVYESGLTYDEYYAYYIESRTNE